MWRKSYRLRLTAQHSKLVQRKKKIYLQCKVSTWYIYHHNDTIPLGFCDAVGQTSTELVFKSIVVQSAIQICLAQS